MPSLSSPLLVPGASILIVFGLFLWFMRGKWDLLAGSWSEWVKHALTAALVVGTTAGTAYTFSNGKIRFVGAYEVFFSTAGIVLALEAGFWFVGRHVGQLEQRIRTLQRREVDPAMPRRERATVMQKVADQIADRRRELKWARIYFGVLGGVSTLANFWYRKDQLGNAVSAILPSIAPGIMVWVLTIGIRPVEVDHAEHAAQSVQRLAGMIGTAASHNMLALVKRMHRGRPLSEAEKEQLLVSAALMGRYMLPSERREFDATLTAQLGGARVTEADTEQYYDRAEVKRIFNVPRKTAINWINTCPGARLVAGNSQAKEAPARAMHVAHTPRPAGLPSGSNAGQEANRASRANRANSGHRQPSTGPSDPATGPAAVETGANYESTGPNDEPSGATVLPGEFVEADPALPLWDSAHEEAQLVPVSAADLLDRGPLQAVDL